MSNYLTIGERPNKKNIESHNLTRKVNLLSFDVENCLFLQSFESNIRLFLVVYYTVIALNLL